MKRVLKLTPIILLLLVVKVNALELKTNDTEIKTGSEVCYKTECFYVLDNNDKEIRLLSKYNLNVGGDYNTNNTYIPYSNYTNIQDSNMLGHIGEGITAKGTIPYGESSNYNNSKVKPYVDNYKNKLEDIGLKVKEATLITKDELIKLGCDEASTSCENTPSWVYSTSYWTITPGDQYFEWIVLSDTKFDQTYYGAESAYGVRPVITLSYDTDASIKELIPSIGDLNKDFNSDDTEYEITIPKDTTNIKFDIKTSSENSKVISGEECEITDNVTECKVIIEAENKNQKIYTIKINKNSDFNLVDNPVTGSMIKLTPILIGLVIAFSIIKVQKRKPIKNI